MAVNQPPVKRDEDQADAAWKLEVAREINRLEQLINELQRRLDSQ